MLVLLSLFTSTEPVSLRLRVAFLPVSRWPFQPFRLITLPEPVTFRRLAALRFVFSFVFAMVFPFPVPLLVITVYQSGPRRVPVSLLGFGGKHQEHVPAFHARHLFDDRHFLQIFHDLLEQCPAQLRM